MMKEMSKQQATVAQHEAVMPSYFRAVAPGEHEVIGRQLEIEQLATSLVREQSRGAVLIGTPGTGRMSVVRGLVAQIKQGNLPALSDQSILRYTGKEPSYDDRTRLKDELAAKPIPVMVIRLQDVRDSGTLNKFLEGAQKVIAIGTMEELFRSRPGETPLVQQLDRIKVDPLPSEDLKTVVNLQKTRMEERYQVTYPEKVVDQALKMTSRPNRQLAAPGATLRLLDMVGADARVRQAMGLLRIPLTPDDLNRVHTLNQVGARVLEKQEHTDIKMPDLATLQANLAARVIGQRDVTDQVARAVVRSRLGISDPTRPLGCYAFFGTTGVGKTETAKVLADEAFGGNLIRINMSELDDSWSSAKLLGSAPGYVGYRGTKTLVDRINEKPSSVVLFDEMEKANPKVLDLLLQILDDGQLVDSKGATGDFTKAVIILTSNLGASALRFRKQVGFGSVGQLETDYRAVMQSVREAINKDLRPELVNRLDNQFVFHPLGQEAMVTITKRLLAQVQERLAKQKVTLTVEDGVAELIAKKYADQANGARPLKRAVTNEVEDGLAAAMMASGQHQGHFVCRVVKDEVEVEMGSLSGMVTAKVE